MGAYRERPADAADPRSFKVSTRASAFASCGRSIRRRQATGRARTRRHSGSLCGVQRSWWDGEELTTGSGVKHSIKLLIAIIAGSVREDLQYAPLHIARQSVQLHGAVPTQRAPDLVLKAVHLDTTIHRISWLGNRFAGINHADYECERPQCGPCTRSLSFRNGAVAFHNSTDTPISASEQAADFRLSFEGI